MNENEPARDEPSEGARGVIVLAVLLAAITAYGISTGVGTRRFNAEAAPGLIYAQLALGAALIAFLAFGAIRIWRSRPPRPDASWIAHWGVYSLVLFGVWGWPASLSTQADSNATIRLQYANNPRNRSRRQR